MTGVGEKVAQGAIDIPAAAPAARRGRGYRLVAPYQGVEQTSALSIPGAWRVGWRILFIFGAAAGLWIGGIGLFKLLG